MSHEKGPIITIGPLVFVQYGRGRLAALAVTGHAAGYFLGSLVR